MLRQTTHDRWRLASDNRPLSPPPASLAAQAERAHVAIKEINSISQLMRVNAAGTTVTGIVTQNPSTPLKYATCHFTLKPWLLRRRVGEMVPHGRKVYISVLDGEFTPAACGESAAVWEGTECNGPAPCQYFFAQTAASPPTVEWNSLLHACKDYDTPDALAVGAIQEIGYEGASYIAMTIAAASSPPPWDVGGNNMQIAAGTGGSFAVLAYVRLHPAGPTTSVPRCIIVDAVSGQTLGGPDIRPADGRACAGSSIILPRRPLPTAGINLTYQIAPGLPLAAWLTGPPGNLIGLWWRT